MINGLWLKSSGTFWMENDGIPIAGIIFKNGLIFNFFQQPGHIFTQNPHRAKTFFVLFHIAFVPAESHVPIAGTGDDHLATDITPAYRPKAFKVSG